MIDPVNKFLFIHIPRTGGSRFSDEYWNQQANTRSWQKRHRYFLKGVRNGYGKHFYYKDYCGHFAGHDVENFYKITIVRNIWDLVVSNYWAWAHPPSRDKIKEKGKRGTAKCRFGYFRDFREYVVRLANSGAGRLGPFTPIPPRIFMSDFIKGCENNVKIIRYENYNDEIKAVFNDLGMVYAYKRYTREELMRDYSLRYCGIKKRPIDYREMYTPGTRDIVYNLYKKDIKKFNYEF